MAHPYTKDETFLRLMDFVLDSEGGYVNDPHDAGGPTKYGIAWNYNADYLRKNFGLTQHTMRSLTPEQAKAVYYDRYWLPSGGPGISDLDLAYIHFDAAVNCGVGQAKLFLKRLSQNPKYFDGSGGKNRTLFMSLFLEYTAQRLRFYTKAKKRDRYLAGWINRMSDIINNSLDLD